MMKTIAPTWLLQMPWLIGEAERQSLHRELAGISQERMVRELAELIERFTQKHPLLLVTEDLHWSDQATLRAFSKFTEGADLRLSIRARELLASRRSSVAVPA
jgi:predicted ATPase